MLKKVSNDLISALKYLGYHEFTKKDYDEFSEKVDCEITYLVERLEIDKINIDQNILTLFDRVSDSMCEDYLIDNIDYDDINARLQNEDMK